MNKPKPIRTYPEVQQRARELRRKMTTAEAKLWECLRDRCLAGLKFRRQHPLGPFITDFYCAEHRLVIEVDGDIHDLQSDQDEARTHQFENYDYRVNRFRNDEVEENLERVLSAIVKACQINASPRSTLPSSKEEQI